jgi:hypothetical protein
MMTVYGLSLHVHKHFFSQKCAGIFSESLRLVLADRFLRDLKLDALSTLYYVAPPSFVFISMGFAAVELGSFEVSRLFGQFSFVLLLNGFLAFALNVSHCFPGNC